MLFAIIVVATVAVIMFVLAKNTKSNDSILEEDVKREKMWASYDRLNNQ